MVKIRKRLTAHRPTKRRLAQLYCAVLYNANLKGFVSGKIYTGPAKAACVPGLNCYSCPGAVAACPLGALQNALASSGTRAGTYVLGILLLYGLILGRTICGWLCPFGMIQELLHKIPTPKIGKSSVTRILSYLKYAILAIFSVAIPLWYGLRYDTAVPGFCKYICPAGTFEGAVALLSNPRNSSYFSMLGILFTRKIVIMLVIALTCIFCYRSFCRERCLHPTPRTMAKNGFGKPFRHVLQRPLPHHVAHTSTPRRTFGHSLRTHHYTCQYRSLWWRRRLQ